MQASFSIGALLGMLVSRRRLIFAGTAAITLIAVLASLYFLPRKFVSGASLLPDAEASPGSSLSSLLGQAGLPFDLAAFGGGGSAEIHREILGSYSVCRNVVEGLQLYEAYGLANLRREHPQAAQQEAVARLQADLAVDIDDASGVLRFAVLAPTPSLAKAIAGRLVAELDSFNLAAQREAGDRRASFLSERLAVAERELDRARAALRDFSASEGLVHLPAELEAELALVGELNRQLVFKELERATLNQDALPEAPALRAVTAEIAVLRAQLAALDDGGEGAPPGLKPLRELPALALRYYELRREMGIQEEISNLLVQQLEQSRLQAANTVSTLRVLDSPREPTLPVWPRKKLIVAAAALVAFVVFSAMALWLEFLARVRRNAEGRWESWQWLPGTARSRRF
jgi:tyrosine-protein kinase Etk/Wzc